MEQTPKALVFIRNGSSVQFRFTGVPREQLQDYLTPFRKQFPGMRWNPNRKVWELSAACTQDVYELCRAIFYREHVDVHVVSDTSESEPIQLPLLN